MTKASLYSLLSIGLSVAAIFAARPGVHSVADAYMVLGICGLAFLAMLFSVWVCVQPRMEGLIFVAFLSLVLSCWYWCEQVKAHNPTAGRQAQLSCVRSAA